MTSNVQLQWIRPNNVSYPKVWRTFEAKESKDSDKVVKYIIQDLPEDRFEDAIRHMTDYYMVDHPLTETTNGIIDEDFVEESHHSWRAAMEQKCSLVCFRENCDEIVGLSLYYIEVKKSSSAPDTVKLCKTKGRSDSKKINNILYANFCPFEKYNVDKYLESDGVSVQPMYRGCGIAQHILEAGKTMGTEFGLKMIHTRFSSEQSSRVADRLGFKVDVEYSIEELNKIDPSISCTHFRTNKISLKTWIF